MYCENGVPSLARAYTFGMYCTRFSERSSVSTKTMFVRLAAAPGSDPGPAHAPAVMPSSRVTAASADPARNSEIFIGRTRGAH